MKIIFDSAFDGRVWPIWPYEKCGSAGEIRLGCRGVVGYLETVLGLRGPDILEAVRISSLIPFLKARENRSWSSSFTADPFGVARTVLHLYDFLILHGWQKQPLTPRLADLADLSGHILPGIAQRLNTLCEELVDFNGDLAVFEIVDNVDALPLLWKKLFGVLQERGVVHYKPLQYISSGEGDLAGARSGVFSPCYDGSLQLVRPYGMLAAAEEVAAWLAALQNKEGLLNVVIVGGDAVLDNALNRFGLPVTGAEPEDGSSLLQLLPLVLAMGHNPPDPARVMELLTLPVSPIPKNVGFDLRKALMKWPAVGSDLWRKNLKEGLQAIDDAEYRSRIADRLELLFSKRAGSCFTSEEILQRVDMLTSWLRSHFRDDSIAFSAINQCSLFKEMVLSLKEERIEEPLLQKLLASASSEQHCVPVLPAQAGLASVPRPEAVVGKAGIVVWWNFERSSVPSIKLPLFSKKEMDLLFSAGVRLPDSAILACNRAEKWRRPLYYGESKLLLICPHHNLLGESLYPHPLWDELLAASDEMAERLVSKKIKSSCSPALLSPARMMLPRPESVWNAVSGMVKPREEESPSSLENFLGCPLKWSLHYCGKIRGNHATSLPDLVPVLGSLAHGLLEEILDADTLPTPEEGEKLAEALFSQKAPKMVAALFQEGKEAEREQIRHTVMLSTRVLLEHLLKAGVQKVTMEQELSGVFSSQRLKGFADIIVDNPFTVIDMKRSWSNFYKKKMEAGTALQLVLYSFLLKELRGRYPQLAYYTLEDQILLTTDSRSFPLGEKVDAPGIEEIFGIFEETFNSAWRLIESGVLLCPGNNDNAEEIESRVEDDKLILEPPCRFCEYDVLCGRRFRS